MSELLAPAGDWESLKAAVANGADAVYFGLSAFNARARATNFALDELPTVIQYLHDRNVRGFVALNVLIFTSELPEAAAFIAAIAAAGVDAVIVQDLGLVRLIKALAPTLPVHGSTQMTLTEPRGIEFVRSLGVERVVLARELSLDEIRAITAATTMPVEVFVHGALCVAYSGQCLTSEALGGRSANRGQCAQACRMPYEMLVDGEPRDLGDKAYLLSPQDLAAYDWVKPLVDVGVISFKIEGRLKGGPYVAATTQTYRKAIDAALASRDFQLTTAEQRDLAQVFSRGLTPGFLAGNDHQKLVRGRFPKSRGVRLGTVVATKHRHEGRTWDVLITPAETGPDLIAPGCGVLFDLGRPEEQEPGGRVWESAQLPNGQLLLGFERDSLDLTAIPVGCSVWKTDDPQLRKRLEQSYSQDKPPRREILRAALAGTLGGTLTLTFNEAASATWPGPLAAARQRATTVGEIREQLARLGETPYELGELTLDLPGHVMIPKSVLNDLRRQAVAILLSKRSRSHVINEDALRAATVRERSAAPLPHGRGSSSLSVLCRSLAQLDAALLHRPDAVYCDFEDLRRYRDAVARARAAGVPIGLAPLRVWKPGEDGLQAMVVKAKPDLVLVRNLASIHYFREQRPEATLVGDFSLNVANDLTAGLLFQDLAMLTPSFDLNWEQFASLMRQSDAARYEVVIHQHMPMFHMEHCVFAAFLSTGKDHRDCGRPCDRHQVELRDRTGAAFPVLPDTGCRNTVFNSVPQSAAEYLRGMRDLGVCHYRIDLLRETAGEIATLIDRYRSVLAGTTDGRTAWAGLRALNQLGVTRGTLNLN